MHGITKDRLPSFLAWIRVGRVAAVLLVISGCGASGPDPLDLAAALDNGSVALGKHAGGGWADGRGCRIPTDATTDAIRAGVLLMDLAVAVAADDSALIGGLATQIRFSYDNTGRTSRFGRIAAQAGMGPDSLRPLLRDGARFLETMGTREVRLGAWLEAASLSAAGKNAEFFRVHGNPPPLARKLAQANPDVSSAVESLRAALPAGGAADWVAARGALHQLRAEILGTSGDGAARC